MQARAARMVATGTVAELTDTYLRIEQRVKGNTESKEFTLVSPASVHVGDKVKVAYTEKDGSNVAGSVTKVIKRAVKRTVPPGKARPAR